MCAKNKVENNLITYSPDTNLLDSHAWCASYFVYTLTNMPVLCLYYNGFACTMCICVIIMLQMCLSTIWMWQWIFGLGVLTDRNGAGGSKEWGRLMTLWGREGELLGKVSQELESVCLLLCPCYVPVCHIHVTKWLSKPKPSWCVAFSGGHS